MVAFGTSGLRGLAVDLLDGPGYTYAAAFAQHLLASDQSTAGALVLVGCDRRASSPDLTRLALRALRAGGLEPVYCGVLPTPALACHALNLGASAVMVTGSHIPPDRNGLKFYRPDGEIDKTDERAISQIAATLHPPSAGHGSSDGLPEPDGAALASYVSRYASAFPPSMLAGKRVGVYRHSSVARDVLADIASLYGAEIVPLGASDEFVAIDTEAIDPQTAALLASWSKEHRLDTIISTDGDGDRPLMTDETGTIIRGDTLGLLAAMLLKADLVVTPVSSNPGIVEGHGFRIVRTRIGSPFVLEGMAQAARNGFHRIVGFEANGGLLVGTTVDAGRDALAPLPTRDSVLPIFCAAASAFAAGQPLSAVVERLGLPIYVSGRVEDFARRHSDRLMAYLRGDPKNAADFLAGLGLPQRFDETDGLQVFLDNGDMIHLRPSGNAPEMRCYASAASGEKAAALLAEGLARIERFPQQMPGGTP